MGVLKETLLAEARRPSVITDCEKLVDDEVAAKKGVTGLVIKGGYKAFKAVKPGIVHKAVDHLLDDFTAVLDRHYDIYSADNPDKAQLFDEWARRRDSQIANDLLGVTDEIMEKSDKKAIKKIYSGMRNIAQRNVAEAIPAVGRLVIKHLA